MEKRTILPTEASTISDWRTWFGRVPPTFWRVAGRSRPGAFGWGLGALVFLTLFSCAGQAQSLSQTVILEFRTLEGIPIGTAQVLGGGTTKVAVALQNPERLEMNNEVRVTLSATTVTTVELELTLTRMTPSRVVSIAASVDAGARLGAVEASGEVLSGGSMVAATQVVSTSLAVEVVPRRFRLELGEASSDPGATYTRFFSPGVAIPDHMRNTRTQLVRSTINVVEDSTINSVWVMVSITHPNLQVSAC